MAEKFIANYSRDLGLNFNDMKIRLIRNQLGNIPEPGLIDYTEQIFSSEQKKELTKLRQASVELMLSNIAFGTQVISDQEQDYFRKIYSDPYAFLLEAQNSRKKLSSSEIIALKIDSIDENFLVTFILSFVKTADLEIAAQTKGFLDEDGADLAKIARYIAKITFKIFHLLKLKDNAINFSSLELIVSVIANEIPSLASTLKYLAEKILIEEALSKVKPPVKAEKRQTNIEIQQQDTDKTIIESISNLPDLTRNKKTIALVRKNTEQIRELIPELKKSPMQTSFWAIHSLHFSGNPFLAQLLTGEESTTHGYWQKTGSTSLYEESLGKTRVVNIASGSEIGSFTHLEASYLPVLEAEFFKQVDQFEIASFRDESNFLKFISLVDTFLIISHLPFDGAGRTIEDFIVLLGDKFNHPLTISTTGYREATSFLMTERTLVSEKLKREIDLVVLEELGLDIDPNLAQSLSTNSLLTSFAKTHNLNKSDSEKIFAFAKALISKRIIDQLNTNSFEAAFNYWAEKIPSLKELNAFWGQATNFKFNTIPPEIAEKCDYLEAQIVTNEKKGAKKVNAEDILKEIDLLLVGYPDSRAILLLKRQVLKKFFFSHLNEIWQLEYYLSPEYYPSKQNYLVYLLSPSAPAPEEEFMPLYEMLAQEKPNDPKNHRLIGDFYYKQQDYQKADQFYLRAIQSNPKDYLSYLKLAELKSLTGQDLEALEYYLQFVKFYPDGDISEQYYEIAKILIKYNRDNEAEGFLRRALSCYRSFENGRERHYLELARLLFRQNNPENLKEIENLLVEYLVLTNWYKNSSTKKRYQSILEDIESARELLKQVRSKMAKKQ